MLLIKLAISGTVARVIAKHMLIDTTEQQQLQPAINFITTAADTSKLAKIILKIGKLPV